MHGLDKVANVLHVAGPASVHSFGRPAFPAVDGRYLAPGPASLGCTGQAQRLRHWTAGFPRSRRLSRPAHSAADGGGRRRFGGVASTSVAIIFAFRAGLWVLWDDRNCCSAR